MNLLSPLSLAIAAGIAVPILLALYILKLKRRPFTVPSAIPWWNDPANSQASTPWQKLRTPPLFWLQLLALLLLALALGRPVDQAPDSSGRRLVIAVDVSASMSAADPTLPAPTRLAHAKATALNLVEQALGNGDGPKAKGGVMVVAFASGVAVMQDFTRDKTLLRRAIDAMEPTDQSGRLDRLLGTLASQVQEDKGAGLRLVLLTDGRLRQPEGSIDLPAEMQVEVVRCASDPGVPAAGNAAFVSFGAQRQARDPTQVDVEALVQWVGPQPLATTASLLRDGRVVATKEVVLPALGADGKPPLVSLPFKLSCPDQAVLEVRLAANHRDALAVDDAALLALAPPKPPRVLLVCDRPSGYEERALRAAGVEKLSLVTGAEYDALSPAGVQAAAELVVLVGHAPKRVPPVPSVCFGCVPPVPGLGIVPGPEADAAEYLSGWQADDPMLRHVQWADVIFFNPGHLVLPEGATALAAGRRGPVMAFLATGDQPHQRHVVTSFLPADSRWVTAPAFPIFFRNALASLAGLEANARGRVLEPGQTVLVRAHGAGDAGVPYRAPAGTLVARPAGVADEQGQRTLAVGPFDRCGLYSADDAAVVPADRRLAVSLLDPQESDLRSVDSVKVGGRELAATGASRIVRREWWPLAVLVLLLVLTAEWVWYAKRSAD